MPRAGLIIAITAFSLQSGYCQVPETTVFRKVTFAKKLGKQAEPGSKYEPTSTVYLSTEIKGRPKSGKAKCKYYWKDEFTSEATVDLADVNAGVLLSVGE